ncbi:hypothetical protein BGZ65_008181, partial [Modicella reniformis]
SIRVLVDQMKRGYDDCEVLTIEGQPALPHLSAFAETIGYSKDSGVRLNQALASYIYNRQRGNFILSSGGFSERVTLPDKGSVTFELKCANSPTPVTVEDAWFVVQLTKSLFTDHKSYLSNVCHASRSAEIQKHDLSSPIKQPLITMPKKSALLDILGILDAEPTPNDPPYSFPDATYIGSGNATVYYQLKSRPDVGVIVVHTLMTEIDELNAALKGLQAFYEGGVTRLVIDFQGNGGGSVGFASLLVQAFFPNNDPLEKSLPSDLRTSKSIQDLSTAMFNTGSGALYNAAYYYDLQTKSAYQNNSLFDDVVTLTRNGRQATYSKITTFNPWTLPTLSQLATYPWTAKADHITILTDGRCGSSCALSSHYFHTLCGVPAFAIGGYQGQDLSMFSFSGGAASSLTDLNSFYSAVNVTSPMKALPYTGDVHLPILEVYAKGASVPLEYDPPQHIANVHLDFDTQNARRRDIMWGQVAGLAWV